MNKLFRNVICLGLSGLLLTACAASDETIPDMPVEELYMHAYNDFQDKEYE